MPSIILGAFVGLRVECQRYFEVIKNRVRNPWTVRGIETIKNFGKGDVMKDPRNLLLEDLNISIRVKHFMQKNGIKTLGQMADCTEEELWEIGKTEKFFFTR